MDFWRVPGGLLVGSGFGVWGSWRVTGGLRAGCWQLVGCWQARDFFPVGRSLGPVDCERLENTKYIAKSTKINKFITSLVATSRTQKIVNLHNASNGSIKPFFFIGKLRTVSTFSGLGVASRFVV